MKNFTIYLLVITLTTVCADAIEQRTYYSADKSKSFTATLTAVDAKKGKVTVRYPSGSMKSFPINVLSEDCKKYILSKQDALSIARYIRLDFDEVKGVKSGDAIPTHYNIEVYNRGENSIQDVQIKYTLYYTQGNLNKGGSDRKTATGTLSSGKIYDSDSVTLPTQSISIVRKSKPASGGG